MNLKKLKKLIKEEIKKLQEQPTIPWFENTGYNLASTYVDNQGGVIFGSYVIDPDNYSGPIPNNFGTNTPMTPCANGGRNTISIQCGGGQFSYATNQIEPGYTDGYGFQTMGQTTNYIPHYSYCVFINGQQPNISHIGKTYSVSNGDIYMILAITPFNTTVGNPGGQTLNLCTIQDGCDSCGPTNSYQCVAAGTPQASCVSLSDNSGPFDSLGECLDSGCAPINWEGSCDAYDNFIEQSNGLTSFEVPEEISLEEGKEAFCDKCYGKENIPQSWVGDPWGFCTCCPPLEITTPPVDNSIPVKEPLKGPSIDKEDPQIQQMQKLAGIKPEKNNMYNKQKNKTL